MIYMVFMNGASALHRFEATIKNIFYTRREQMRKISLYLCHSRWITLKRT